MATPFEIAVELITKVFEKTGLDYQYENYKEQLTQSDLMNDQLAEYLRILTHFDAILGDNFYPPLNQWLDKGLPIDATNEQADVYVQQHFQPHEPKSFRLDHFPNLALTLVPSQSKVRSDAKAAMTQPTSQMSIQQDTDGLFVDDDFLALFLNDALGAGAAASSSSHPGSSVRKTNLDDPNLWYEDYHVNALLRETLDSTCPENPPYIFATVHPFIKGDAGQDIVSLELFNGNLEIFFNDQGYDHERHYSHAIIPINTERAHLNSEAVGIGLGHHYVLLYLLRHDNGNISVCYIDPFGDQAMRYDGPGGGARGGMPHPDLLSCIRSKALAYKEGNKQEGKEVQTFICANLTVQQQYDSASCGPWLVINANSLCQWGMQQLTLKEKASYAINWKDVLTVKSPQDFGQFISTIRKEHKEIFLRHDSEDRRLAVVNQQRHLTAQNNKDHLGGGQSSCIMVDSDSEDEGKDAMSKQQVAVKPKLPRPVLPIRGRGKPRNLGMFNNPAILAAIAPGSESMQEDDEVSSQGDAPAPMQEEDNASLSEDRTFSL